MGAARRGTVYLDPERSVVRHDQRAELRRTTARIGAWDFGTAHLRGYTDSDGSWASGLASSQARTQTIARWLSAKGIESEQAWYGEGDDPTADNDTAAGKARNRRVELWVSYFG